MYRKVIFGVALTLGATIVHAQEAGWYGGLDLGRSHLGVDGNDIRGALSQQGIAADSSIKHDDTAFGFDFGYRVNRNFALEGAYTDLGKFAYSAASTAPGADVINGNYRASAVSLAAVGIMPLQSNWSIYGKAGFAHTQTKLDASSSTGATAPGNASDSGNGLMFGAGVMYDINRSVYAKAGWDRYANVGSDATGKGNIDLYSVGVGYRF